MRLTPSSKPTFILQTYEERESFRLKRQQKEEQHAAHMSQERVLVAVKERDLRMERDKQDMTEAERELTRLVRRQPGGIPPPPPPPLPSDDALKNNQHSQSQNLAPLDSNLPPLPPFPPDCPTPDYDKESLASSEHSMKNGNIKVTTKNIITSKNGNADFVEMQSLESFKLTNPSVAKPKPPPIYFKPNMNGSSTASSKTSSDTIRPNITIREYPKNTERKNPERFQFLGQNGVSHPTSNHSNEPITARLQDELSQALSKANLKCSPQTEAAAPNRMLGKNTVTISISAQPNGHQYQENYNSTSNQNGKQAPFYLHNNGTGQPNNNSKNSNEPTRKISTTVINQAFSNRNGVKSEEITGKNCVSFHFGQAKDKVDPKVMNIVQPSGILKNGIGGTIAQVQMIHPSQAKHTPSKSIKFAGITTAEIQGPKK